MEGLFGHLVIMKIFSAFALILALTVSPLLNSAEPTPIPFSSAYNDLQAVAVTVKTSRGSGSGVIVLGANGDVYAWTAQHVVEGVKEDVALVKQIIVSGRTVGFFTVMAEIVATNATQDLAVLKARSGYLFKQGAKFEKSDFVPGLGDRTLHVGSFLGLPGAESFSSGEISYVGRVMNGQVFDQLSNPCFPGSSGGPVFNESGLVIGLVVSGYDATFSFAVPIRRMAAWAIAEKHPEWLGK